MILFFVKKSRDKSDMGINLKRVYCPGCGTKQPFIRKPKNSRQAMYGGYTCPKCNTEMDKYGDVIKSDK
jgi:transposase-like protein